MPLTFSPATSTPPPFVLQDKPDAPDLARFFADFESLAQARLGRPHWGKEMDVDARYVLSVYPKASEFVALARRWDPDGTMRNAFLDRALG